jgi:EAL domain
MRSRRVWRRSKNGAPRATTNEREPQEVERRRLALPVALPPLDRVASELQQPGLFPMQFELTLSTKHSRNAQLTQKVACSRSLTRGLGMASVAEGVETEDDWHLLRELDCDQAQGYFIGRPMAAQRLPEWTVDRRARRAGLFGF